MRIGIIAEGTTDQAVITNILKGLGIDTSMIVLIRPDLKTDEIDKNFENTKNIGTWQGVKNSCISKEDFELFFTDADNTNIIIQLDTAEANHADFNVIKPNKTDPQYATKLRQSIIEKIHEWLDNEYTETIFHAIAIEEMEAWILTIYINTNTITSANPKNKMWKEIKKNKINNKGCRNKGEFYEKISSKFTKRKLLLQYANKNQSLNDFINEVQYAIDNKA